MEKLLERFAFHPSNALYLKDPLSSPVGMQILASAVPMLQSTGLEGLTFKKLAFEMKSTEATIYRYFSNKQQLLMYSMSIYAAALQMKMMLTTSNIAEPKEKLRAAIKSLLELPKRDSLLEGMRMSHLHAIWCTEMPKHLDGNLAENSQRKAWYQDITDLVARLKEVMGAACETRKCSDYQCWMLLEWTQRYNHPDRNNLPFKADKTTEEEFVESLIQMFV